MNIHVEINRYHSAAEIHEEAKARRKRFEKAAKLALVSKPKTVPVVDIPVQRVFAKHLPAWESGLLTFDAHVIAYRVSMAISSFSLSGAARPASEWNGKFRRSINDIVIEVLERYPGVTVEEVQGNRRLRKIIDPRQESMFEVYTQRPDLSLPMIGRWFRKDHTTILHAIRRVDSRRKAEAAAEIMASVQ